MAQQNRISVPKYEDLTEVEGTNNLKFVVRVSTRSKVPDGVRDEALYNVYFNPVNQYYPRYQYKDFVYKGNDKLTDYSVMYV